MNADKVMQQRIGRLTPLADVLATIARIDPVAPREVATAVAAGCVLAADVIAPESRPAAALALRDGWAVSSDTTRDAGPYAPLTLQPPPQRVDAFAALPPGTDAVAPLDAVSVLGSLMQIMTPAAPGESILPSGGDVEANAVLCRKGARLRASDIAVLTAARVEVVAIRQPHIRIVNVRAGDKILDTAATMIAQAGIATGATAEHSTSLDDAFSGKDDVDAIIAIGGTGEGRDDRSIVTLARAGTVTCHGIGLSPRETTAFGFVKDRPVLLMPGRIDAALACWLVIGRALLARLTCADDRDIPVKVTLARKVTSTVGIAEVIPLRRVGDEVEPLASGYLSLQSLARADGWMLVPAESEGYPAGTAVEMRPLP
jgi:molybdopterin molybdotransferase